MGANSAFLSPIPLPGTTKVPGFFSKQTALITGTNLVYDTRAFPNHYSHINSLSQKPEKSQCHKSSHALLLAYLSNSGLADFSGHGFKLWICSQVQLVVPQEL